MKLSLLQYIGILRVLNMKIAVMGNEMNLLKKARFFNPVMFISYIASNIT